MSIGIQLQKSFEGKTGLKQTFVDSAGVNRQVRTIKALTVDDVKPSTLADVEEVISWSDVQSSYAYKDEDTGEAMLLHLDDKTVAKIFKKSEVMMSLGFVDRDEITPDMFAGDHYFVTIQVDSKTKTSNTSSNQGYSLLFFILKEHRKMFLVQFISGDREKFAVIYAVGDGLKMSTIIHSNYQREAPTVSRIPMPNAKSHAEKLIKACNITRFDPSVTNDMYEDSLLKYIDEKKKEVKGGKLKVRAKARSPVSYEVDFFSQLDAL